MLATESTESQQHCQIGEFQSILSPFLSLSHFLTLFERRSRNVNKTGPLVLINGYDLSERRAQLSEVVLLLVGW